MHDGAVCREPHWVVAMEGVQTSSLSIAISIRLVSGAVTRLLALTFRDIGHIAELSQSTIFEYKFTKKARRCEYKKMSSHPPTIEDPMAVEADRHEN